MPSRTFFFMRFCLYFCFTCDFKMADQMPSRTKPVFLCVAVCMVVLIGSSRQLFRSSSNLLIYACLFETADQMPSRIKPPFICVPVWLIYLRHRDSWSAFSSNQTSLLCVAVRMFVLFMTLRQLITELEPNLLPYALLFRLLFYTCDFETADRDAKSNYKPF